ncbi:hypothetical protein EDI_014210 [Entamoeba dispar SAW760]|uniref:C3H1-type domain-containing protein n=1 Tax=Entamoeba dispar (strain ATCC PRA-260 / SAW760) TaxID=370354 RepID=B0EHH5_ENTDS|nr:uncharacterized protein EDI_014210 [Entamoeba dispar SAW760]EDR26041.1 hypothetical protein EDI_014210 [Entamoeba dispar SAW760]|eukprot:EDR26041.1 hypothetical protein EDI_014210 [Entamoeba dispar SAW760]
MNKFSAFDAFLDNDDTPYVGVNTLLQMDVIGEDELSTDQVGSDDVFFLLSSSFPESLSDPHSARSSPDIVNKRERDSKSVDFSLKNQTENLPIKQTNSLVTSNTASMPEIPFSNPFYFSMFNNREIPDSPQKHLKYGTKPCIFFMQNGYCKKGGSCTFSHDISSLNNPSFCQQNSKQFISVDKLYRTKPCKYFFETGVCRKGEHCNFSHDLSLKDEYFKGNF